MFPTLEVKFNFFYSLTKRIQGDSYGLLKEAIHNISDVGYSILVAVPGFIVFLHNNGEHKSFVHGTTMPYSPALDNTPRSRVPPIM
jgi:hypothetical protein